MTTVYQSVMHAIAQIGAPVNFSSHAAVYSSDEANAELGMPRGSGTKTLLLDACGAFYAFSTLDNLRFDFRQIKAITSCRKVVMLSPGALQSQFNIDIGAVAPFGYPENTSCFVDRECLEIDQISINPGLNTVTLTLDQHEFRTLCEYFKVNFY